jgi:hypothetical protein
VVPRENPTKIKKGGRTYSAAEQVQGKEKGAVSPRETGRGKGKRQEMPAEVHMIFADT